MKANNPIRSVADELAKPHHLVTAESQGKPLCGEASPEALIGSFVEHLDDDQEFIREIFGRGGKPANPCQQCLSLYPSLLAIRRDDRELKRIVPFNLRVNVAFAPDINFSGYRVTAHGVAEIADQRIVIGVFPQMSFTTARWFYSLNFKTRIDAPLLVPLVNKANKDK
jgi:hypothetical protein